MKRVKERDESIEELYQQVEKECSEAGRKLLFKYTDENKDIIENIPLKEYNVLVKC